MTSTESDTTTALQLTRQLKKNPEGWSHQSQMLHVWYIYLHDWVIFGLNVGKYSSTMVRIWEFTIIQNIWKHDHCRPNLSKVGIPQTLNSSLECFVLCVHDVRAWSLGWHKKPFKPIGVLEYVWNVFEDHAAYSSIEVSSTTPSQYATSWLIGFPTTMA